ncbi:MAG: alanine racemase [Steroidobacteraceae bacterium]
MTRLIRAVIDRGALQHNLTELRRRASGAKIMAVVKANAYGHGLVDVATTLGAADALAVARLDEALALRQAGISGRVVLLEGVFAQDELAEAIAHRLDIVLHDPAQLALLGASKDAQVVPLWIKLDSGMNRLGFAPDKLGEVRRHISGTAFRTAPLGLMTHLARADETAADWTRGQLARFATSAKGEALPRSIANSAGVLAWPDSHADWVRPGIALYGISPFGKDDAAAHGLRPVMQLLSTVIAIRPVRRGDAVGYGGTWVAPRDSRIAVLAGGYGDGLPRNLAGDARVSIAGQSVPVVGRVSMDMVTVDVTDATGIETGAGAVLWGADAPVEALARCAGTIPYELVCGVSQRVPRELI